MKQSQDDFQLVRAFQNGDEKAFEELIKRYQRQVANIIYLTLGGRDIVEDLTQEVFIRAYRSLSRFAFDASFYSWLYRITVNLCIDEIRRRKLKRTFSLDFFSEERAAASEKPSKKIQTPSDALLENEKRDVVAKALQRLKPSHRSVLILREYEDLTYEEIAQTLRISLQAVKSRIFRAREEMRTLLKEYFQERL
ncbi:MAG: sigma-70 family RNA polymerase sigma factor [Ignavibacteriales bacterium]|nr:sigma-70 family RNA polymerase sigma factor [Ignavibacteriales bacterium]